MKQKVILISGLLKSGKSTLANELFWDLNKISNKKNIYSELHQYAFADRVKRIAKEQFGWDGKKDEKGRLLLQRVGTEVGRFYNEDIWVDYFSDFMNSITNENRKSPYVFLIDDWRFKNEADNISFDYDGSVYKIRVLRDIERNEEQLNHPSENGLPKNDPDYYDFILENNYESIEKLRESEQYNNLFNRIQVFILK